MKKTYKGSCHLGRVRFEADIDLNAGTGKCNCSICTKARSWGTIVKANDFRLLARNDDLTDYQFGSNRVHHLFCEHCGVKPFGRGHIEAIGGVYSVNLGSLDEVDPKELADASIQYFDGRNDKWELPPAETRHL